jgi:hypothetical protein
MCASLKSGACLRFVPRLQEACALNALDAFTNTGWIITKSIFENYVSFSFIFLYVICFVPNLFFFPGRNRVFLKK